MMPSVKEPLAGLALLVILGFLIWYNRPLENARLFDPYLQDETARLTKPGAYEAWLWQDPFGFHPAGSGGAAETWALAARGEKRGKDFSTAVPAGLTCKDSLSSVLEPEEEYKEKLIKGKWVKEPVKKKPPMVLAPLVKVAPRTAENKEMRTRQRYAVVAGLVESGYQPAEPGMLHFCSIQENRREKDGSEKDSRQKDRREYDMRWERYRHESNDKSEHALNGNPKPDIIVAWIDSAIVTDESKFPAKHPCTRKCDFAFKNLLKEISRNNKLYLFDVGNILDAGQSCQIESHIHCIHDPNASSAGKKGKKGEVKSSTGGSIELIKLAGMEGRKQDKETQDKEKQNKCNAEANVQPADQAGEESRGAGKQLTSHVAGGAGQGGNENASEGTDSERSPGKSPEEPAQCDSKTGEETGSEKLAGLLATELMLRGITHRSQVMTISEQGSENAATLRGNLGECLSRLLAGQECAKPDANAVGGDAIRRSDGIRNVFYLKGLDGKNPGTRNQYDKDKNDRDEKDKDGKGRSESGRGDKSEKAPSIELRHSPPLSVGASQLDYFYRLAEEMNNAHHVVDFEKRDSGIRAVVILGSDFHDKLLIIQALREKMPHLLILTTDLDARMLHPKHWRATRNLVVASHFDLRLREKPVYDKPFSQWASQGQFPPFRDSQQTNIFYRTLSIGKDNTEGIAESAETFPRIFEVGRNGFVRLGSVEKDSKPDYHPPDDTRKNTADALWLLLGIAVSLIVFQWAIRPWSGLSFGYLFFGTSVIFALAFGFGTDVFSTNELNEPFSFTDGVSLWPTLFLQIIAGLLAIWFFIQAQRELKESFGHLSSRYSSSSSQKPIGPDKCELWLEKLEEGMALGVLFFILLVTVIVYAGNDVYPSKLLFFWCIGILAVVTIIYLLLVEKTEIKKGVSIKHWVEDKEGFSTSEKNINDKKPESVLWDEYCKHGRVDPRSARVIWIWLIFAIIETLLVYLLPPWPLPWRGAVDPANWFDVIYLAPWVGVLSFTVTMLLLFFVLDAVRLNFYWIRKLCTQHPLFTGEPPSHDYPTSRYRLERMILLVAERTQAVDRLIYYPMFCIMLMLLARITYFDNQEFPLSKGITFAVAISFLFFSGFVLRSEANELRLCAKRRVRDMRSNSDTQYKNGSTLGIDETIKRIDAIDEGAFKPMLEQPVMQALLIMLASVGLFAGEYLKVFG